MISALCHGANEVFALPGCFAARSGKVTDVSGQPNGPNIKGQAVLSPNIGS